MNNNSCHRIGFSSAMHAVIKFAANASKRVRETSAIHVPKSSVVDANNSSALPMNAVFSSAIHAIARNATNAFVQTLPSWRLVKGASSIFAMHVSRSVVAVKSTSAVALNVLMLSSAHCAGLICVTDVSSTTAMLSQTVLCHRDPKATMSTLLSIDVWQLF